MRSFETASHSSSSCIYRETNESNTKRGIMRKQLRGQIAAWVPMLATAGLSFLGAVSDAQPRQERECTQDSLYGDYGYVLTGPVVDVGPQAAVGLASFDGAGGLTARDTISDNGTIGRRVGTGSYSVNVNCTGSAVIGDDFGELG